MVDGRNCHRNAVESSSADAARSLVPRYAYELPFGPGKRWLQGNGPLRFLAAGWIVNGIRCYQSGTPLTVTVNSTLPIFNRTLRPDVVTGVNRTVEVAVGDFQVDTDRRLNRAAFSVPGMRDIKSASLDTATSRLVFLGMRARTGGHRGSD